MTVELAVPQASGPHSRGLMATPSDRFVAPICAVAICVIGLVLSVAGGCTGLGGSSNVAADSAGTDAIASDATRSDATPTDAAGPAFQTAIDEFAFAIQGDPETLDPGLSSGVHESHVTDQLFEGLTDVPPTSDWAAKPVPGVAARWEVSDDGLVYTFHLRKGAKWSNGEPVTAEDFRWSWMRLLDPKTASRHARVLWIVDGARDFAQGLTDDPSMVGVEVIDAYTLRVRLAYVAPYFLELCHFHPLRPVHRAALEAHGARWTRPENMVSNGPYMLAARVPNRRIQLVKNPHYWDRDAIAITRITVIPLEDSSATVELFESGRLDWTGTVELPSALVPTLALRPTFHNDPYLGVSYYRINVTHPALKDNQVRRALSMAIDRDVIVLLGRGGHRAALTQIPDMPGYTAGDGGLDFEPERARELLAAAGYPGGKGFPSLRIVYNTLENHRRVAEIVKQMWQRHLGIGADLISQEWKVYLESQQSLAYDIGRAGWTGDYRDPLTFLEPWTAGNGNNHTGWSDREYDGLIERSRHEANPAARFALLSRAESVLLRRGPIIPLYHYARPYLLNPAVAGFAPNLLNRHPVKYMSK